ncbi:hypothetical protein T484DRAFT_1899345 [Baffinella frigidus]|nr:hypothetical protein T484DRAFT_1899345 [Cryptophyta sp. CCMP2293]
MKALQDARATPADLRVDFPGLAADFSLPELFEPSAFFSSVLRVRGTKRVVLFAPRDADKLYMVGDKSRVADIEHPDLARFPLFRLATPFECTLLPGDVLFIPALWFHNVLSVDFSVAVNVFWKHLPQAEYVGKDAYGNKDPASVHKANMQVSAAIKLLSALPPDHCDFFARRLIHKIQEACFLPDHTSPHPHTLATSRRRVVAQNREVVAQKLTFD